jgi:hypothetical protein
VLKSRPRDLEDTLAQLVHEDDPVVAAAAIHFVGQQQLWSLVDDLEYVSTHRSEDDRVVTEAASWALALRQSADSPQAAESLPIVELADRVRAIPLFASLSIDELFRIAEAGQETRHPSGRDLCHAGAAADDVLFPPRWPRALGRRDRALERAGGTRQCSASRKCCKEPPFAARCVRSIRFCAFASPPAIS